MFLLSGMVGRVVVWFWFGVLCFDVWSGFVEVCFDCV